MHKALIIEDDATVRGYLKRIIQLKFSFNIAEAENGSEGLEALQKSKPDIIFLDISMPVMNGIEFLQKIKVEPEFSSIPILVITAHNDKDSIQKMIELGISDYILKPINPEITFNRIQSVLNNIQ